MYTKDGKIMLNWDEVEHYAKIFGIDPNSSYFREIAVVDYMYGNSLTLDEKLTMPNKRDNRDVFHTFTANRVAEWMYLPQVVKSTEHAKLFMDAMIAQHRFNQYSGE